jgi:hypothetical protein
MTNLCVYISLEATVLCLKRRILSVKFGYPDSVPKDLTMSNAISVSVVGIPLVNFVIGHGAFGLRKGMAKSSYVGATIRAQAQSVLVASRLAGCLFTGAKHGDVLLARVDKPIPEQAHSETSTFNCGILAKQLTTCIIDHSFRYRVYAGRLVILLLIYLVTILNRYARDPQCACVVED